VTASVALLFLSGKDRASGRGPKGPKHFDLPGVDALTVPPEPASAQRGDRRCHERAHDHGCRIAFFRSACALVFGTLKSLGSVTGWCHTFALPLRR
jgi:hypothetical protein